MSRADLVHRLVQEIANLAADAEGEPRRAVPRLDNDLALPDQLRVVAADLVAAGPPDASAGPGRRRGDGDPLGALTPGPGAPVAPGAPRVLSPRQWSLNASTSAAASAGGPGRGPG